MKIRITSLSLLGFMIPLLALFALPAPPALAEDPIRDRLIKTLQKRRQPPPFPQILLNLESTDSRARWLAAGEMGISGKVEAIPHLMKRLGDRNMEVRRQALESLFVLGRNQPADRFDEAFEGGLAGLDNLEVFIAQAFYHELHGNIDAARAGYLESYAKDGRLLWLAYRAYGTEELLARVEAPLLTEITTLINGLKENLENPKPTYPQSMLRQAYALTKFVDILSRRAGYEALEYFSAGNQAKAKKLKQALAQVQFAARQLDELAKSFELELKLHIPNFEYSDSDPARAREISLAESRAHAARQLGEHNHPETEKALIQALQVDPSPAVRIQAAASLGRLCRPGSAGALVTAFQLDESMAVRQAVLQSMGCFPEDRTRSLIYQAAMRDEYKEAALLAIGRLGGPEDIRFLREAARKPGYYTRVDNSLGMASTDRESILLAIAQSMELAADNLPEQSRELRREASLVRQKAAGREVAELEMPLEPEQPESPEPAPGPATVETPDTAAADMSTDSPSDTRKPATADAPVEPAPTAEQPPSPEPPKPEPPDDRALIREAVERWLEAWRNEDLEVYIAQYHPNMKYKNRDLKGFRAYKALVFKKHTGVRIGMEDLQIRVNGPNATVTFLQDYKSNQLSDYGRKTLTMKKDNGKWLIYRETWKKAARS